MIIGAEEIQNDYVAIFKGDIPWDPQVQKGNNIMIANRNCNIQGRDF